MLEFKCGGGCGIRISVTAAKNCMVSTMRSWLIFSGPAAGYLGYRFGEKGKDTSPEYAVVVQATAPLAVAHNAFQTPRLNFLNAAGRCIAHAQFLAPVA